LNIFSAALKANVALLQHRFAIPPGAVATVCLSTGDQSYAV
jgi:hypothetical protein